MSQVTQPRVRRVWVVLGASVLSSLLLATPALAGDVQLSGLQSAPTHQRFIVKYRDGSAPVANTTALASSLKTAAAGLASSQGRALGLQEVRKLAVGPTLVKTDRPLDQAESELLMRKLAADPNVEYVEVDQIMRATLTPNDTRFSEQWGFGTSNASINVRPAWDKATGTGVVVAVIDTGITNHPDLNANILPGYDFISDAAMARDGGGRDNNPNDEGDWYGANECGSGIPASNSSWHGTHVAGTVAAVTNNSTGVAGTAFNAKVVPVRVLGKCGGYTSDIADAIVGLWRHRQWRAGQRQPGRGHQHVAGWWRHLLGHLPERHQRRGQPWYHRGGRRRQQQHQRVLVGAGQLRERDRGGGHDLGRCACQLLQLRCRHRHFRPGPEHPVHPQHRYHHAGQRQLRVATAPRWRRRMWPAWLR